MLSIQKFRTKHSALIRQIWRYGSSGLLLAILYSFVYWRLATRCAWPPELANLAAFLINLAVGWVLHSRWSFQGDQLICGAWTARMRFAGINLLGLGCNALWVWLTIDVLHRSVALSTVPIVTLTPAINFMLNRMLIFRTKV